MSDYILELQDITKSFSGVEVLHGVDLRVKKGEIRAIVGENGAGKSTLVNIVSGVHPHGTYRGEILFEGGKCSFHGIRDSEEMGIVVIHQELTLIPHMSIAENMFLGNERSRNGVIDWDETAAQAARYLEDVSLTDNASTLVKDIGIGKQQLVEIAKALAKKVSLLILDEPTATLNEKDSMHLLDLLLSLKKQGLSSIIISHKLNEVSYVADSITIMRDGSVIETLHRDTDEFSEHRIVRGMVGREMTEMYPKRGSRIGGVGFEVRNWTVYHPLYPEKKVVDDVSIDVRKGEVVGIYGLMGAGRTEFAMSVFGRSYGLKAAGTVVKEGREISLDSTTEAIRNRVAYIPEDRKAHGLNLKTDVRRNISIAGLRKITRNFVVNNDEDIQVAEEHCRKLSIKASSVSQIVESLSGGNQQKVVFAKWIYTHPDVLILDEPTRGVDVGAKYEIYRIINGLVEDGACAIFISSDLTEILGMCDRIYIMNEGKIVGELPAADATQEKIMSFIVSRSVRGNDHADA